MILLADCRENTNLNDLFDLTGKAHNNEPHERGKLKSPLLPPLSSSRPFKCSAWNYNKNLHQVWGKNSLDVIEQHIPTDCAFHPSGTAEEFAGQAVGPVSLCSPFFFFFPFSPPSSLSLHRNVLQHGKSSPSHRATTLPQACQAHLFIQWRRADTQGNQKVGFHPGVAVLCYMTSFARKADKGNLRVKNYFNLLNRARQGGTHS